jgi:WD40 repeat protein
MVLIGAETAWVREIQSWSVRSIFAGQQGVRSAAFSSDERRVATADRHGTVRVWDIEKGAVVERIEAQHSVEGDLGFTDDGSRLVTTGAQGQWDLWKL